MPDRDERIRFAQTAHLDEWLSLAKQRIERRRNHMSNFHLLFGGRVKDPRGLDFDLKTTEVVGLFPDYASAYDAWRGRAQRTVDDAEMKYVVVHLHRLLEPEMEPIKE